MLDAGTIVAGYRVEGVLGQGGMAVVYRATQLSLNRIVALKLLSSELSDDPSFRERFRREGQLQAGLDHVHIVPIYEAGDTEWGLFLSMRLIAGSTLKELILARALNPRRTMRILAQVAQALDAAHAAGLIHRDVKPQNILIGEGDQVYLADFGLIKSGEESALTSPGQFMGTIDYVAPEQIQGEPASAASDCYALTAVLYECLADRVPFPNVTEAATLHDHIVSPPPRPSVTHPDLPAALDDVITAGMAKDPARRPASASELIKAAARAIGGAREQTPPRGGQPTQPSGDPVLDGAAQITRSGAVLGAPTVAEIAGATRISAEESAATVAPAESAPVSARAPEVPPRSGGRAPVLAGLTAILLVAAAVAGFLVGHPARSRSTPFANAAASGPLQFRFPARWHTTSVNGSIPGLTLQSPVALSDGQGATLIAGTASDAEDPTLLSTGLRGRITQLPAPEVVSLGGLPAERYTDLTVRGASGSVTVYALPTTAGVATIACRLATDAGAGAAADCAQIAETLTLSGARVIALGPSPGYARDVDRVLGHLGAELREPARALASAHTPGAQAAASRRLAAAFDRAHTALATAAVPPQAGALNDALLGALAGLHAGYATAASAAQAGAGPRYRAAGRQVQSADGRLQAALRNLGRAGYRVSVSPA